MSEDIKKEWLIRTLADYEDTSEVLAVEKVTHEIYLAAIRTWGGGWNRVLIRINAADDTFVVVCRTSQDWSIHAALDTERKRILWEAIKL